MDNAALAALVERSALGDHAAFAKLYRRSAPYLFAVSLRVLQDRDEAERALADAYLKIWRYAERYRATSVSPVTWMAAIVRNLSIARLRARKTPAAALKAADTLAAATQRADGLALNRTGSPALATCLARLDANESRLLRIAYFGGATYTAIAERDGITAIAARQTSRRPLMALQSLPGETMSRPATLEAVEYVLALVDDSERREFELALLDEPDLAATVWQVEESLAPLGAALRPRKPSPRVWRTLRRSIAAPAAAPPPPRMRSKVAFWRAISGFFATASVVALCAIAVLMLRPEAILSPPPVVVAALAAPDGSVTLARMQRDGTVVVEPLSAPLPGERQAMLWLVQEGGAALPLGALTPGARTVLSPQGERPSTFSHPEGARLEVTAEAADSATATPTGNPIAAGPLRPI